MHINIVLSTELVMGHTLDLFFVLDEVVLITNYKPSELYIRSL